MLNWILTGVLTSLQIVDIITTMKIISRGGRELNPAMLAVMKWLGQTPALIVTKCSAVGAAVIATIMLGNDVRLSVALVAIGVAYIAVLINNVKVLKKLNG